jgi:hypothetical protein
MDNKINHDIDFTLSDSVLLRIYNHFYFLNLSNGRQKTWSVIMGKEEKQKILYYMLSFEDSIMLNRLKKITKVKETKDSTGKVTNCVINPTSEEFRKILKGNLFTITDTLTKIK